MSSPLRIVFAGTPEFSVPPLQRLLDSEHEVIAVYTQPDRPAGRGRKLTASPVKALAEQTGIPVFQPLSLKSPEAQAELAALNADVMVVVAYGLILPQAVLDMPTYGCYNIHASLLPRWRGAAPIQRAIEQGDAETGVTIMQMDAGLDTGAMLTTLVTPIHPDDTAQSLHDRLSQLGCDALMTTLDDLLHQRLSPTPQQEDKATYAEKLSKAEAEMDWREPARILARKIHAFNPWPVAFTHFKEAPLRIWRAQVADESLESSYASSQNLPGLVLGFDKQGLHIATGQGILVVEQLQPAGKKAMNAYDFAQSRPLVGEHLG